MKKILLSSLLAVMAVTSANAKIASTGYVDAAEAAANAYTDDEIAALVATTTGNGVVVTDVTQTDGKVTVTKGNIAYSDLTGKPTVDTEMKDDSTNAVQNKVIKSYVDNAITTVEGEIGGGYQKLEQKLKSTDDEATITTENRDLLYPSYAKAEAMVNTGVQSAKDYTDDEIAALVATTTGNGVVVTDVTQTDGKVTVTKGNIAYSDLTGKPTVDTEMKDDSTNAVQNKVIKSYVDTEVGEKQDTLTTEQLAAVNSGITEGKVNTYDGYNATITQNTNDIAAITSATVAEDGKEDGQYVLTKKVVDGVITYSWESIDRTLAN